MLYTLYSVLFFLKIFIYLFLEIGEEREKERERNSNVWLPLTQPPLGTWPATQACALDWELNPPPFGSQAGTQSTEPHQSRLNPSFCKYFSFDTFKNLFQFSFPLFFSIRKLIIPSAKWGILFIFPIVNC